jgi:hypothetical protein
MAIQGDLGLYLSGMPVPVSQCNIVITPPKVKEILMTIGEDDFLMIMQIIGHTDLFVRDIKEGNPELNLLSDFQVLLVILQGERSIKALSETFFDLIFPEYNMTITENSIEFRLKETDALISVINPFNFPYFQRTLSELFEPQNTTEEEFNPIDDKAREIAEKLKRGREKRNQLNAKKDDSKMKSLFAVQTSVLSVGLGIDINTFFNYTPFQLYDAFMRYTSKLASDFYRRVSSMPFMDTSQMEAPPEWTRGLY